MHDSRRIRIAFSRYNSVVRPGGSAGPWETACAEQGLAGEMKTVVVDIRTIGEDVAQVLGIQPGSDVAYRLRHACVGDEVLQVQQAWYPADVAFQAGLDVPSKIRGGIYGALTAAGLRPVAVDEAVSARMPTRQEVDGMRIGPGVQVLAMDRITRGADGRVLELLQVAAPSDRVQFVYDNLPLAEGAA